MTEVGERGDAIHASSEVEVLTGAGPATPPAAAVSERH